MNPWHLHQALRCIRSGGVIAYPTEAVWGLGCDPTDKQAVHRILDLKSRPEHKGLVLVGSSLDQFQDWIKPLSDDDMNTVMATWPGPMTWVLPCYDSVPTWLRGEHSSLAVRISDHPIVKALCNEVGPLVSTSANPAGKEPARSALKVRKYFPDGLNCLLPGKRGGRRQPSEIRTLDGQRLR